MLQGVYHIIWYPSCPFLSFDMSLLIYAEFCVRVRISCVRVCHVRDVGCACVWFGERTCARQMPPDMVSSRTRTMVSRLKMTSAWKAPGMRCNWSSSPPAACSSSSSSLPAMSERSVYRLVSQSKCSGDLSLTRSRHARRSAACSSGTWVRENVRVCACHLGRRAALATTSLASMHFSTSCSRRLYAAANHASSPLSVCQSYVCVGVDWGAW